MNTESIVTIMLAAASALKEPAAAIAAQTLKDLYSAARYYLRRKFTDLPDAARAFEFAAEKPSSTARRASLLEELEPLKLECDPDLVALIERLSAVIPDNPNAERVSVTVEGRGNQVNLAGRDVVITTHMIRRNAITPDDRHLARDQRARLLKLIHDLAARLGPVGRPNVAAVHRLLQRRFDVVSYLLIPRERYAEALQFLRQRRAARRDVLLRRDPALFRRDLFRAIFAQASELSWSREEVYAFAQKRLGLLEPITSLRPLGGRQLQALAAKLRRIVPPGLVI